MFKARENNAGWRIDYFLTSQRIRDRIYKTPIYSDIMGSDHCPVGLELDTVCNGGLWSDEITDKPTAAEPEKTILPPMSPAVKAGVAAGIFAVGFATGTLVMQKPAAEQSLPGTTDIGFYVPENPTREPIPPNTIPPNTIPLGTLPPGPTPGGNFGLMDDFASMSTMELISEVLMIQPCLNVGANNKNITKDQYEGWKRVYPVFEELERREDAIYLLGLSASIQSNQDAALACYALQTYYQKTQNLEAVPGEVLIGATDKLKVYEQTQKMTLSYTLPSDFSSIFFPAFYAGDREFVLTDYNAQIDPEKVNFYVRIVATDASNIISPLEVLVNGVPLEQYGDGENWIRSVRCMNTVDGIFLFGHISEQVELDIMAWFAGKESGSGTIVNAAPVLEGFPHTEDLARYICAEMTHWQISDDELQTQPNFVRLQEQSNCIETLYRLATSTSFPYRNMAYKLLTRTDLHSKMTDAEKQKFAQLLSGLTNQDYFIPSSMTNRPTLAPAGTQEDPFAYYVHMTQKELDHLQLEQYDCFVKVALLPAGKVVYEKSWSLVAALVRGSDASWAECIVWETYDATGENLTGWIIAAKLGCDSAEGTFHITNPNEVVQRIQMPVYPMDHDYTLDSDIFVDSSSSSSLVPIS